jgi:hypothetical protein
VCKWRFVGGAYSGSRDPSAMARARVTMRQLGVVTCMAPAFANAKRCEERVEVQRAVRRWGVLRFPISASAWRARARHVQLQRAPATCAPQWSTLSELKTASRTLALERKRPVKPTELFELFKDFKSPN